MRVCEISKRFTVYIRNDKLMEELDEVVEEEEFRSRSHVVELALREFVKSRKISQPF